MPTKEYILSLNEGKPTAERFIIQDLDDTRLFVQPTVVEWLQQRLKDFQEEVREGTTDAAAVLDCTCPAKSVPSIPACAMIPHDLVRCRTPTSRPAVRT